MSWDPKDVFFRDNDPNIYGLKVQFSFFESVFTGEPGSFTLNVSKIIQNLGYSKQKRTVRLLHERGLIFFYTTEIWDKGPY